MVWVSNRMGRRTFLWTSTAVIASYGAALAGLVRTARARSYGPLVDDPEGILDLPEGFTYRVVDRFGDAMSDGYVVPARPDGMACFEDASGNWVLMRNHEVDAGVPSQGAYPDRAAPTQAYDSNAYGGVTRVVLDPVTGERISSNLVLTGTIRNCAGGMSPWGWLTCEETFVGNNLTGHGYVFVCAIDAESVTEPQKIAGYGRFNHEAACIDPATNICYLTEDRDDSCLYRFVPAEASMPFQGRLQALRVVGTNAFATTTMTVGQSVEVEWIDVDDSNPAFDDIRSTMQGQGAAVFVRGEGIWFHEGEVYVCSTSGGAASRGQIFRLVDDADAPTLELIAMSSGADELDAPDNITVAPWGQLFMAEDGSGDQYVRALTDDGTIVPFARNAASGSELAGVCFSPDGTTMFVNIQGDGLTLAITGPFPEVPDTPGDEGTGGDDDDSGGDEGTSPDSGGANEDGGDSDPGTSTGAGSGDAGTDATTGTESGESGDAGQDDDDNGGSGCNASGAAGSALLTVAALAVGSKIVATRNDEEA